MGRYEDEERTDMIVAIELQRAKRLQAVSQSVSAREIPDTLRSP